MQKKILAAAVAASVLCAGAWAMNAIQTSVLGQAEEAGRAGAIEKADQRFASHAENMLAAHNRKAAALDVGDADSFGRPLRWLGVVGSEAVNINSDCASQDPEQPCLQIDPDTHSGSGEYRDIGSITLPAGSTHSQICHWLSPTMNAYFANHTGLDDRNARFTVFPSVTFENAVLNNPALVDPNTGEPLAGKVELGVPSISIDAVLDNGERTNARNTATRTCTGGLFEQEDADGVLRP